MGHTRRENDVTYRDFGRRWQMTHQTTQIFLPERTSFLAQSEGLQGTTAHSKSIFICLAFFTPIRNFAAAAQTRVHWLPANCGGHQCRQGKDNRMLQTIRQLTAAALYSLLLFSFLHAVTITIYSYPHQFWYFSHYTEYQKMYVKKTITQGTCM